MTTKRPSTPAVFAAVVVSAGLAVASCGGNDNAGLDELITDTGDFKSETEAFLNDNSQVEDAVGGAVSDAECDEPSSMNVGTQYQCVANVAGTGEVEFDVEIDQEDSYLVVDFRPT